MLLAIDIGNPNIVFGIHENNQSVNHWRIQTDPMKTADEHEVIFRTLLTAGKIFCTEVELDKSLKVVATGGLSSVMAALIKKSKIY